MPNNHHAAPRSTYTAINKILKLSSTPNWADSFGRAIATWARNKVDPPIRTLSLFSGAGGLDIGFHDAGFQIHTMIEVDDQCVETLRANSGPGRYLGSANPMHVDIRRYRVPRNFTVDFIIGGPPCQPFSAAGRRMAGVRGTRDKQGDLFRQYVRILKKLSPRGFLFENVYGLIGAEDGRAWQKIKRAFEGAGYKVAYRVIDAADYGVPQHRKRVFIVGTKDGNYCFPQPTHGRDAPGRQAYIPAYRPLRGIRLTRADRQAKVNGKYGDLLPGIPPGLNYSFYTEKMGHPRPVFAWRSKFYDFLYKADPKAPIRTLKADGGYYTGPFHWDNRRFSLAELKRLQTIPDSYRLTGGREAVVRQIGNSVPPQLARMLALSILSQVFEYALPFDLPLLAETQSFDTRQRKPLLTTTIGQKAKAKIQRLRRNHVTRKPRRRNYVALLSEGFEWTPNAKHDSALSVSFVPSERAWTFAVSGKLQETVGGFQITITPRPQTRWGLHAPKVLLLGNEVSPSVFTGAWKAFESELLRLGLKADLVQLSGYYQYPPAFQCTMSFDNPACKRRKWKVISKVVSGIGVGKILSYKELGALWDVTEQRVLHYAVWLRELGYEVRNRNTNPQLPDDHLLIPYAFPTLNPMSVQLHKKLDKIYRQDESRARP